MAARREVHVAMSLCLSAAFTGEGCMEEGSRSLRLICGEESRASVLEVGAPRLSSGGQVPSAAFWDQLPDGDKKVVLDTCFPSHL